MSGSFGKELRGRVWRSEAKSSLVWVHRSGRNYAEHEAIVYRRVFLQSRVPICLFNIWSARCGVPPSFFFAHKSLAVDEIWGGPAKIFPAASTSISAEPRLAAIGRDWPRLAAVKRRRATRRGARFHARIPRITVVAKDKLPQIIIIIIKNL